MSGSSVYQSILISTSRTYPSQVCDKSDGDDCHHLKNQRRGSKLETTSIRYYIHRVGHENLDKAPKPLWLTVFLNASIITLYWSVSLPCTVRTEVA